MENGGMPENFARVNASVKTAQRGAIKVIAMDREDGDGAVQKNAMNDQMWKGLTNAIREADKDSSTTVIILQGHETTFCGGADMTEFRKALDSPDELKAYAKRTMDNLRNFTAALIDCKKIIVALVEGRAVGIGVTMLPLCDFVYASEKATFTTPFAWLGIVPECCSTYTFPKIMGNARASAMLYANQGLSASQAHTCGLVTSTFTPENFKEETTKLVNFMLQFPAEPILMSKQLVREGEREMLHKINKREAEVLEPLIFRKETTEIVRKFVDKK